jgi:hypothetical protein
MWEERIVFKGLAEQGGIVGSHLFRPQLAVISPRRRRLTRVIGSMRGEGSPRKHRTTSQIDFLTRYTRPGVRPSCWLSRQLHVYWPNQSPTSCHIARRAKMADQNVPLDLAIAVPTFIGSLLSFLATATAIILQMIHPPDRHPRHAFIINLLVSGRRPRSVSRYERKAS